MTKVQLFDASGAPVKQVEIPALAPPGIVIWGGMMFRLENGRYVFSTAYHVIDTED